MEVDGQFHLPATLPLSKELLLPLGWGSRADLDSLQKRKISCPFRELNHNSLVVLPVV